MRSTAPVLVCFAVEEEAHYLRKQAEARSQCEILITGIGPRNARHTLTRKLGHVRPQFVISSGFAGGLNPELKPEMVVWEAASEAPFSLAFHETGAYSARFYGAERIATTAAEKRQLRNATGADAVEMESGVIREICLAAQIPCGIVRIISDAADEDLPLDFNRLMTPHQTLDYLKLAGTLAKAPWKAAELWSFRRRIHRCARKLAVILSQLIANVGGSD
ncbi:MAG: hypothetical protein HY735_16445 [Verrucomicrobia bacterium]|nr:hypothetical protein [Verrucomicrobiota bacterium]